MRSPAKCSLIYLFFFSPVLFANNLKVQNASLVNQQAGSHYTYVQFDVSWDNSWRDVVNWDAAWVFVKYKGNDGLWKHATLSVTSGDHTAPSGSAISAVSDGKGIFIYRNANGSGANSWTTVQLRWNYGSDGLSDNALVTVKVFGIEMVYVPQGSFYAGDASAGATLFHFYDAGLNTSQPYLVSSQSAITYSSSAVAGNLWGAGEAAGGGVTTGTTNAGFPTGYNAFYCMKYEVTQEQYVDFLNTLTRTQQNNRVETPLAGQTSVTNRYVMSNSSSISFRNAIRCDATISVSAPVTFYCDYDGDGSSNETNDGQNIACNSVNWMDGAAYADWSALRPYTELEFEKAARGDVAPVPGEYAWGSGNIASSSYLLSNDGSFDEVVASQPTGTGNATYGNTYGLGPLRAGIFALSGTTRETAGASYYGIMELSGNLREMVVSIASSSGRPFTGSHGNGFLSVNGNADDSSWPGYSSGEVTGEFGAGGRGGGFQDDNEVLLSDRTQRVFPWYVRTGLVGIRAGRTAP